MPVSNDNQDYNEKEQEKNNQSNGKSQSQNNEADQGLTSDNLKGKKVDADPENPAEKPADV